MSALLILSVVPSQSFAQNDFEVYINHYQTDPVIIKDDRTLVKLRDFEKGDPNAKISWNQAKRQATITHKNKDITISFIANDRQATVNAKTVNIDTNAIIKNDRIYVPLRFTSETFEYDVTYSSNPTNIVQINDIDPKLKDMFDSKALGKARYAATKLPKFWPRESIQSKGSIMSESTVYFPGAERRHFVVQSGSVYTYFEVNDYIAEAVRQVDIDTKARIVGPHPYLDFPKSMIEEEWGQTPTYAEHEETDYLKGTLQTQIGTLDFSLIFNGDEQHIEEYKIESDQDQLEAWEDIHNLNWIQK